MARPVVDRLERELEGRAEVLRVPLLSPLGTTLARRYGIAGVPTVLVFDGAGQVIYRQGGMPDRQAISAAVDSVLGR